MLLYIILIILALVFWPYVICIGLLILTYSLIIGGAGFASIYIINNEGPQQLIVLAIICGIIGSCIKYLTKSKKKCE